MAQVSTHDTRGGAAKACFRLHQGLLELGCDSTLYCRWKHSNLSSVVGLHDGEPSWKAWLTAAESFRLRLPVKTYRLGKNCDLFSLQSGPCKRLPKELLQADVIHLHWVTSMIDLEHFFSAVPTSTPIVWTLHDMNLLTGGCHFSGPCVKFRSGCGACPELTSSNPADLASRTFERKKKVLDRLPEGRLTLVCPSTWMESEVASSLLLRRFSRATIPYGVDFEQFRPDEQQHFRQANGIGADSCIILFVSDHVDNHRKGFDLLHAAFRQADFASDAVLITVGSPTGKLEVQLPNIRVVELGRITNPSEMAMIYSAADFLVIPSRQDNLPNTVLEAMACGTPVLGFDVGGIPDMVKDGVTGRVVATQTAGALAASICQLVSEPHECRRMGESARKMVLEQFSLDRQARDCTRLYRSLLNLDFEMNAEQLK